MGRFWSKHLLYGETYKSASPMWDRDPTYVPIFEEPLVAKSPMLMGRTQWRSSLRLTNVPVFVDEDEPDCQPMWDRDPSHVPVCPCCIDGTRSDPLPRSLPPACRQVSSSSTNSPAEAARADVETNSVEAAKPASPLMPSNIRLRHSVSSIGLRFKKSMQSLRHKASGLQR
ncbi:hypothetical protein VM1G_11605 [Cytospora mali]|uniref:Uncharacterized protein n=1 Tax=Cytospora mali TaxID=578113 RepID=A0A194VYH9_CYTMA|nr:hypothetical protein VM1G_11605 [Valsa mali]